MYFLCFGINPYKINIIRNFWHFIYCNILSFDYYNKIFRRYHRFKMTYEPHVAGIWLRNDNSCVNFHTFSLRIDIFRITLKCLFLVDSTGGCFEWFINMTHSRNSLVVAGAVAEAARGARAAGGRRGGRAGRPAHAAARHQLQPHVRGALAFI